MKSAQVAATVRVGSLRLDVRKYADGRYGFDYQPPGEKRVKVRLHDASAAEERAREILGAARGGKVERLSIDESEYAEFLRWKAERKKPARIPDLVSDYIAKKETKGVSASWLHCIRCDMTAFAKAFQKPIGDLTSAEVMKWLDAQKVGPRRWNNILAQIVSLHIYARGQRLISAEKTPVEAIERKECDVIVHTYSPEELISITRAVPEEWIPVVALGAFSGIRPQEVAPEKRANKPSLHWKNILWEKRKIDIPAAVAKTGHRRFAPLTDAAAAFLEPWKNAKGPIAPAGRIYKQTGKWSEASGVPWKSDGLRHSFASYRLALTNDLAALSLEMGNSPAIIRAHYLDLKHEDEAERWFAIRPSSKSVISHPPETH